MQEMKKRSIVIASVLKPMDDTRMTEKMGMSLLQSRAWHVHIIGFGNTIPETTRIQFHPLGYFARLSITRMFTPWRVLGRILQIKPSALIITTHELLWVAAMAKWFLNVRCYYDVHENYRLNIKSTNAFPALIRNVVANYVRIKEKIFAKVFDHFLLAEKTYANELPFLKNRYTIIENKSASSSTAARKLDKANINLLFSGTLDASTGVFEAIQLAIQLHHESPMVNLTIIGYAALPAVRKRIYEIANGNSFITLIGIDTLVPHAKILRAIEYADAGIIFYQRAPHTRNRIPTKLYEYLAYQLPILYDQDATWAPMVEAHHGGIALDFKQVSAPAVLHALHTTRFFPKAPTGVTWADEEPKLLRLLGA
jgi:hypothetical protein